MFITALEVPPHDLANKGTYDRKLKNWEWLCRKCHMIKDGRMKKLMLIANKNWKKNQKNPKNGKFIKLTHYEGCSVWSK